MTARVLIAGRLTEGLASAYGALPLQTDANDLFDPPVGQPWVRLTFQDGTEQVFPGGAAQLARTPLLGFVDVFTQLGLGDGLAGEVCTFVRTLFRRWAAPGVRTISFRAGAEGDVSGYYRKQQIVVFQQSERV